MTDIRIFPAEHIRVESGPIQFGEDWPGIFMRGDHAGPLSMYLGIVLNAVEGNPELLKSVDAFSFMYARQLQKELASCTLNCEPK